MGTRSPPYIAQSIWNAEHLSPSLDAICNAWSEENLVVAERRFPFGNL